MNGLVTLLLLLGIFQATVQQAIEDIIKQQNRERLVKEIFTFKNNTVLETKNPQVVTPVPPVATPIPGIKTCECVPYYLCNDNNTINTNGVGVIDIRADEGSCPSYFEVCCNPPDRSEKPITPVIPERRGCGYRNPEGIGFRITGDEDNEAQFGELPWMVAIMRLESIEGSSSTLNVYQCGGALIHPQVVLTAAHCVASKERTFVVRAGEWDTQTTKELYPYQDRPVKSSIIHPEYYAGALYNDMALLILETPFDLAENVDLICLPPQDTVIPSGTKCYASGWGKDVFGKEGKYQVILKKIDLPLVDRSTCQENLRTTRLGKHFELHTSFICAGGEKGKDTCKGDGGSPLVCPIPGQRDRFQQAGTVAWGIGCGENQIPGVYANVALFRKWIDEQIAHQNLNTTLYQY